MSVTSPSRQASGIARPDDWQAPPSAATFQGKPRAGKSKWMRLARRIAWNLLPPLTFVGMVALWWGAVELFRIPAYLLPGPGAVFSRLVTDASLLWTHSKVTLIEILLGFGLTIVTAIPLGLLIALSALAKQLVYPPLMLMQLVPKIAVAPLFLVWLGFGLESKVLLTVLMTFFPLLLASISGFMILDDRLLFLTKSMGASSWDTFRYLRFRRHCRSFSPASRPPRRSRRPPPSWPNSWVPTKVSGMYCFEARARWTSSSCSRSSSCSPS